MEETALASATDLRSRRRQRDRRMRATPVFSRYLLHGRRRRNRRLSDPQERYYVDCVDGPFAWALILVAALVSFDTSSTLLLLTSHEGVELNPIMSWIYGWGSTWFVLAKIFPMLIVLPLLALHRFFTVGRFGIRLILYAYACVSVLHIAMLSNVYF